MQGIDAMVNNDGTKTNEQVFWDSFAKILGDGVRNEEAALEEFYCTEFQKISALCGYAEESKQIVDILKAKGVTTVLATNPLFPKIATESRMRWAGLSPEDFKIYTTYEESRFCKPNLNYYEELISEIGLSPEECLMVGNDVGDDMVAEALGMKVFLLTDCLINKTDRSVEEFPNGNFDKLIRYLEKLT
jgi:FMN phosphatase YigB (HAD superfamily)